MKYTKTNIIILYVDELSLLSEIRSSTGRHCSPHLVIVVLCKYHVMMPKCVSRCCELDACQLVSLASWWAQLLLSGLLLSLSQTI